MNLARLASHIRRVAPLLRNVLLHRVCFWRIVPFALHPTRQNWFCSLRQCRLCGRAEYESFNRGGTGRWHDLSDPTGTVGGEFAEIREAAIFNGFVDKAPAS